MKRWANPWPTQKKTLEKKPFYQNAHLNKKTLKNTWAGGRFPRVFFLDHGVWVFFLGDPLDHPDHDGELESCDVSLELDSDVEIPED